MTDPLFPNQLAHLLPALRHVAELVQRNGALSREDVQLLLLASGLDEDWAVGELERWAKALAAVRGQTDAAKRDIAMRAFILRGVPEASARLAVETAATLAPPTPTTLPIQVSHAAIGFGELKPGQSAQTLLTVSGGPGQAKIDSDMTTVHPEGFGPDETILTVIVKGGLDGQVLLGTLILKSETESVKVDLTARWVMPPEVIDEVPVITPPPLRSPIQSHPRSLRQQIKRIRVACPNCDHQFSVRDAGERQCPSCQWDFEVDEDGDVVDGVPIDVTCPACDHAFKVREAGDIECPACQWDFEVDEDGDVVDGVPIDVTCPSPNCDHAFKVREAGDIECPACQWDFEVDEDGDVVNGAPICMTCPNCSRALYTRIAGERQCPSCQWDFEVDEDGDVVDGVPIDVTCPACDHAFKVREAGDIECPACQWDFEVDEDGDVVDGVPIDVTCPACDHAFKVREAGDIECPTCQWDFEVDEDGDVVDDG